MEDFKIDYPWEDAPDWAEYAAIDQNGEAYWLGNKPYLGIRTWQCSKYSQYFDCDIPKDFNWKKSLQKRPKIMKQQEINYPWEFCPPGYNYAAIDRSGCAFWYRVKPTRVVNQWAVMTEDLEICYLHLGFLNNPPKDFDWKKSLQKRPINESN